MAGGNLEKQSLTTQEVAGYLHCCEKRVNEFRKAGLLIGTKYGKSWTYEENEVKSFKEKFKGNDLSEITVLSDEGLKKYR